MKLAVGFFDGVHLGHRRILAGADAALTFTNHPSTILSPDRVPPLIMSISERLSAISAALRPLPQRPDPIPQGSDPTPQGSDPISTQRPDPIPQGSDPTCTQGSDPISPGSDPIPPGSDPTRTLGSDPTCTQGSDPTRTLGSDPRVRALDFTAETKGLTPQGFIDFLKREYPDLEVIRCGPNWRFGAKGVGNAEFARRCGLAVEEVPFVMHNGEAVSSTRIRKALGEGNVADAAAMLGRPWRISGEVFAGKGEGRKIGFPTLNVRPFQGSVPLRRGVYAVKTELGLGVANWGQAPTMGDEAWKECTLEVHLLGKDCQFDPPKVLSVEFIRFIRPERRFSSITELTRQIEMDVRGCSEN